MSAPSDDRKPNRLAHETSAYLRQHQWNPVDWFPWGEEALERARREALPLLVSIGYSACHWCHVMEHESFEDPETAALMNRAFVCIKVDREERPDVDQIYMDTVTGLTGHGGWPLTVFCLPDGRPFYGGTYYPPEPRHGMPAFRQVLLSIAEAYHDRSEEVLSTATQITEALSRKPAGADAPPPGRACLVRACQGMLQRADPRHGGFGGAPKFPTPTSLDLLLAGIDVLPARQGVEALEHVVRTCREMARGGLYDHLGGGFHRYSVDAHWCVPHFEKMLYDQGQLLRTYLEAWRRSGAGDDDLLWPVRETIGFLEREMRAPDGGWFASQDADSENPNGVREEGCFYVWRPDAVAGVLGEPAEAFCDAYSVTETGNFEGGQTVLTDRAREVRSRFAQERAALYTARQQRAAPDTDEKRVTSWNALTLSGFARAGSLLEESAWLDAAAAAADFLDARLRDDQGRLLRVWNQGRAHVLAFLDDHATLLEACLDLYRAGAGERFLDRALTLAAALCTRFYDADEGDFFLTPTDGERLAQRPRSDHDGATPHSAGLAALGLLRVAALSGRVEPDGVARRVLQTYGNVLERAPEALPTLTRAAWLAEHGPSVAVIVGPDDAHRHALALAARRALTPEDGVLVATPDERPAGVDPSWLASRVAIDGRATAYVCRGTTCSLPITAEADLAPLPLTEETPAAS
ncbi:MAG: thioredoxin domain-containing protein [Myxococcota bacterium]